MKKICLLFLILMMVIGCNSSNDDDDFEHEAESSETRTWSADGIHQMAATTKNGSIDVSAVQGNTVTADIFKKCLSDDAADAEEHLDDIVITDSVEDGLLTLTAAMPDGGVREYQVDFSISIPDSIYLDLISLNGNIKISDMVGGANMILTNGNISARDVKGSIRSMLVNGTIFCSMIELEPDETVNLTAVNGSVELRLPSNVSASFDASTVNGRVILSGFNSISYTRNESNHKTGTIGSGDAVITIRLTNGDIVIRAR